MWDDEFWWPEPDLVDTTTPPDDTQTVDDSGDPVATDDPVDNFDVNPVDNPGDWINDPAAEADALSSGFLADLPLGDNIAFDVTNDAWYDRDTGAWYDIDGNSLPGMDGLQPREENLVAGATASDQLTPTDVSPPWYQSVGDFFSNLFGGNSSGSTGGGGSGLSGSFGGGSATQAKQQAQQAQQALQSALASGANPAQLAALRLQLVQAEAAYKAASAGNIQTLLIVGGVALGAILLVSSNRRK